MTGNRTFSLDGWLTRVALATFAYYLITFAFETGYFWNIGVRYMSAFGLAEHTVHAASYIVGTAGAVIFMYFLAHVPALAFRPADKSADPDGEPEPPRTAKRRERLSWLLIAPMLALLAAALVNFALDVAAHGPSPVTLWPVLLVGTFLFYYAGVVEWADKLIWSVPAALLALLSPFALGQLVFEGEIARRGSEQRIKVGDREVVGAALFVGVDRMLLRVGRRLYLVDRERNSVVTLPIPQLVASAPDATGR